jgi:hypothetical protein
MVEYVVKVVVVRLIPARQQVWRRGIFGQTRVDAF